ncbi:HEPN domain protein [Candidatus Methylomirabilis lanthanidiphila]|uniref:HEPN domain protein n=1 Tax=Candidatus Methylomirabilis lanthanidiphila TaxID=2211376 RepID=A0A564ZGT0_9BACT|nr:HEPN domain-containing protein [Candidatus Methylomirabilis lanthanidiphila]VUZ83852.1 HEPN domain protein [Candidatus Methylomirabilis lanthanidiphila]
MAYEDLRERGLVEESRPDFRQVSGLLGRATQDMATARATISIDKEWAYIIAYQAMLRATKALVMAEGWRVKGRDQARTFVTLIGELLGEEERQLVNGFDRMRRKRQDFMEEPQTPIPRYEVEGALKDAQMLIDKLKELAREKNPQLAFL